MNNWQHSFNNQCNLTEHLQKPYLRFDNREKTTTKVVFDDRTNLIWAGDSYGCVSSYDPSFSLYTRFKGHIGGVAVNDLLSHRDGILSLSEDSLHFSNRRGVTTFNLTSIDIAAFSGLKAMCYSSPEKQHKVYCGGENLASGITSIDLTKGKFMSSGYYNSKVKLLKSNNKLITVGKESGSIDLYDPNSDHIIKSFSGHSATISSMDVCDYTLITAGKSERFSTMYADPFVNVYDLRNMKQLPPISFSKGTTMGNGGADIVQLHPLLPTVMVVATSSGSFDFIDLANPTMRTQYVHPCQSIKDLTLSPNGDYLSIVESNDCLNLWNRSQNTTGFTNLPEPLEYPDCVMDGPTQGPVDIDNDNYPLSSVGLPYYHEKLLSAWPRVIFKSSGTIPRKFDMNSLPFSSNKLTASSQLSNLINEQFPFHRYDKTTMGYRNVAEPYVCVSDLRNHSSIDLKPEELTRYKPANDLEIPPAVRTLPFTSGRFGSNNFDFRGFNKTSYSGLDTDIDNLYTNAILQLYRFVPEVYNFVVGCLKDENLDKITLLSDLGYLYDMMGRSRGKVCSSSGFQLALNSIDEAKELNLVNTPNEYTKDTLALDRLNLNSDKLTPPSTSSTSSSYSKPVEKLYKSLSQRFNDFLLSRLIKEEFTTTGNNTALEQCFGFQLETNVNATCNDYERQSTIIPTLTVLSPARNGIKQSNKKYNNNNNQSILTYIETSMKRIKHINSRCDKCHKQEVVEYERTIKNLPPVLSLEILLTKNEWNTVKNAKNWLAKGFYATILKDKAVIRSNAIDLKSNNQVFKYELNGYVARINDPAGELKLVTYARVFDYKLNVFKWYMLNDYLVIEVDEEEALNISPWWKTPELVIYCDAEELRKPFFSVDTYSINYDILYRDHFAAGVRKGVKTEYKLLTKSEGPTAGTLVAIDAEFVLLNDELSEINCKGAKTIARSKRIALARVSVLRGEESELFGLPFIDDYIVTTDHIENYLTRYSGIHPGDLDPLTSSRPLVMRSVIYRKLWLLLQLGCVFVGHGLYNDFKNININVPSKQIRDTALYFLQGKRYLSLRYLAFVLLGNNVQEGDHDSIEDAHTALILYKKYLNLKENGTLEATIKSLYDEGRASNYKVPEKQAKQL
ncbi:poly(A)-specific ribonuclease NDAI_0I01290 [Naumovozyma dairenensis CBS 421]|uniref:USP domain-containing protein n=1 Tax=Naumovozyma dairenensis (strain ATCC 10597 / BCRC 20456 / CBS 421 / NBRC 0211 / NRRL Y-12639) TaxID=1071378 RepID=G0WFY7_NAUDC|nr:hypothetical protein NDAI_0I01290 [Naumovozyma dairenensis CBS 421]CCD26698.1 hypothetical protein NDAI_0I01290 [Naumovozyma dairenensis CBS 421]